MGVENALGLLGDTNQSWADAGSALCQVATSGDEALAEALQRVGDKLLPVNKICVWLSDLGLNPNVHGELWNVDASKKKEIYDNQRKLSAFQASIQDLHACLGGTIESRQLGRLEQYVASRLIAILVKLRAFARDDFASSPVLGPLLAALEQRPAMPEEVGRRLETLAGRREAFARHLDHAMALRDVVSSPVVARLRDATMDWETLEILYDAANQRAVLGVASLVAAAPIAADLEVDSVAACLEAIADSRRLQSDVVRLLGQPPCASTRAAVLKMVGYVQQQIWNFEGAAAHLSESRFRERGRLPFANDAVMEIEQLVTVWQAIADELIRTAAILGNFAYPDLPGPVVKNTVDAYFDIIDMPPDKRPDSSPKPLREIQLEEHENFALERGRQLIKQEEDQAMETARLLLEGANLGARRGPRGAPAGPARNAPGTRAVGGSSRSAAASVPPPRVTPEIRKDAVDQSRGWLLQARREMESEWPRRPKVVEFLNHGKACLELARLETDEFVSKGRLLLRETDRKRWARQPTEDLYMSLRDDLVMWKHDERDLPRITHSGQEREEGAYIEEFVLRPRNSRDRRLYVVVHVHRVRGQNDVPIVHFKPFGDKGAAASRCGGRIHRGPINNPDLLQDIRDRARGVQPEFAARGN